MSGVCPCLTNPGHLLPDTTPRPWLTVLSLCSWHMPQQAQHCVPGSGMSLLCALCRLTLTMTSSQTKRISL